MASIGIGSDEIGAPLKAELKTYLEEHGYHVCDYGSGAGEDYPDVGARVAEAVARGEHDRAVLVCGTGIGMAIAANKVPGIRAAQIPDTYSAERARKSNDAQIACFGSKTIGAEAAKLCLEHWLQSEFAGGRSAPKVEKLKQLEGRHHRLFAEGAADHRPSGLQASEDQETPA
jgi:ribose 5-phosphate isomerase B